MLSTTDNMGYVKVILTKGTGEKSFLCMFFNCLIYVKYLYV